MAATIEQFEVLRHIGSGAYGEVAAVRKIDGKDEGAVYAMKAMGKKRMCTHVEMVDHEWKLLTTIHNPFFVSMLYSFQTNRHLIFVMPLAGGGDMLSMMERGYLDEEQAHFYTCELVEGLSYLHGKQILHRDIKLENLLIGNDGHLLLTDFGLSATNCNTVNAIQGKIGTKHTMAPEIYLREQYGLASDWWAVGITYCDMRNSKTVFDSKNSNEYCENAAKKRPKLPRNLSAKERTFVNRLLVRNPSQRLGYGDNGSDKVKEHDFFKGVNWTDVLEKKLTPPFIPTEEEIKTFKFFPDFTGDASFPTFDSNIVALHWDDIDYTAPMLI